MLIPAAAHTPAPVLSAIVISRGDEARIEGTVASIVSQQCPEPFEVVVVTSGSDRTAEIVRRRFPAVRVVELLRPALPGEARNAGLRVARGRIISFDGSHVQLLPGSLAARMRAHALGYPMVSGVARNAMLTCAGWATYFVDHSSVLPGRPSGELSEPPVRCSYERSLLDEVGGFPEGQRTGEDTVVNERLWSLGYRGYRSREVTFVHRSPCSTIGRLVAHHFRRGRGLAHALYADYRGRGHLLARWALRRQFHALARVRQIHRNVRTWGGGLWRVYRRVLPLVFLANLAWWAGGWLELLRPAPGRLATLLRTGRLTVAIAVADSGTVMEGRLSSVILVTLDRPERQLSVGAIAVDTVVELAEESRLPVTDLWREKVRAGRSARSRGRRLRSVLRHDLGLPSDVFVIMDEDGMRRLLETAGAVWSEQPSDQGAPEKAAQAFAALHHATRHASLGGRLQLFFVTQATVVTSLGVLQLPAVAWALLRAPGYRLKVVPQASGRPRRPG